MKFQLDEYGVVDIQGSLLAVTKVPRFTSNKAKNSIARLCFVGNAALVSSGLSQSIAAKRVALGSAAATTGHWRAGPGWASLIIIRCAVRFSLLPP